MFGIASYLLVVFWYLGLACAIVAIVLAIYHDRYYPAHRATIVGMWLGIVYVIMFVLIGVKKIIILFFFKKNQKNFFKFFFGI